MSDSNFEVISGGESSAPSFGDRRVVRYPPGVLDQVINLLRKDEVKGTEEEQVFDTQGNWVPVTPEVLAEVNKYLSGVGSDPGLLNAAGRALPGVGGTVGGALDNQNAKGRYIDQMLRDASR